MIQHIKRWNFILILVCILALVGGAGYWGVRSSAAQANSNVDAPNTVAATTCDVQQSVTAPGSLVNLRQVNVEMPADGSLQELLVRPGDYVQEGQVLGRLTNQDQFASAVAAARLELLQAQSDLGKLTQDAPATTAQALLDVEKAQKALDDYINNFPLTQAQAQVALATAQTTLTDTQKARDALNYPRVSQETIDKTQASYDAAQAAYKDALHAANKNKNNPLDQAKLIAATTIRDNALSLLNWYTASASAAEIATADANLAQAQAAYDQALRNWDLVKEGPDAVQIALLKAQLAGAQNAYENVKDGPDALTQALAQAKVDDAQAKLTEAEGNLAAVEIKAPFAGVILEVSANPGETLAAYSKVLVLSDPRLVEIQATVTEEDLPLLKPGQGAQIYFTARPDVTAQGSVDRIVPEPVTGSSPTYDIFISLDHIPAGLVAGMTVDTNVIIARRLGVLCLPRYVVHASADNQAILQVWNGSQAENRQVTIGLRGDSNVEILSGLKAGERVVVK